METRSLSSADLAHVPGLARGAPARDVQRLTGGTVNEVYRVDTSEGSFVLRLDGAEWRRPGVDRERELQLHQCAAAAGLAPRIIGSWPTEGVLVTEYLPGYSWRDRDFGDAQALVRLGEKLQQLHALVPPALERFDPLPIAMTYATLAAHTPTLDAHGRAQVLAELEAALQRLALETAPACILHGDLVAGNLLQSGARLWLLDWEYAQIADPLLDVACVLAYFPAARQHQKELLAAAGCAAGAARRRLIDATYVYEALTWLWYQARGESLPWPEPPRAAY